MMARWPAPGRCKRRLARSVGAAAAARIQARLTRHTLAVACSLARQLGLEVVLAVDGLGPRAACRWGAALGANRCLLQGQAATREAGGGLLALLLLSLLVLLILLLLMLLVLVLLVLVLLLATMVCGCCC